MGGRGVRLVLTIVIDALIILAVALAIQLVIVFTHEIASQEWARAYVAFTKQLVIPFGARTIKTPYGGVFDVNCALTIVVALIAEWGLSAVRDRA
jgi:hypothetical protein